MLFKICFKTDYSVFFIKNKKKPHYIFIYNEKNNVKYISSLPYTFFFKVISKNEIIFVFSKRLIKKKLNGQLQNYLVTIENSFFQKNYFSKKLVLKGLGFKYEVFNNNFIKVNLSYSHPYYLYVPSNLSLKSINNQILTISCKDKVLLNNFNQIFIKIRKPNLFRNKGIFFYNLLQNL